MNGMSNGHEYHGEKETGRGSSVKLFKQGGQKFPLWAEIYWRERIGQAVFRGEWSKWGSNWYKCLYSRKRLGAVPASEGDQYGWNSEEGKSVEPYTESGLRLSLQISVSSSISLILFHQQDLTAHHILRSLINCGNTDNDDPFFIWKQVLRPI